MSVASDSPTSKTEGEDVGNDKQFLCSSPGCNQRFISEEILNVHKQKHQMTLKLGPSKPSIADMLPVDQTPTPTRFLQYGNQMGLFEELNPFDREFKTAQKDGMSTKQRNAAVVQHLQAFNKKAKTPTTPILSHYNNLGSQPVHVITLTPTLPSPVGNLPTPSGQLFVPPLLPSPQGLMGFAATSPMQLPGGLLSPSIMPFTTGLLPGMPFSVDAQRAFTQAMFAAAASASSPLPTSTAEITNSVPSSASLQPPRMESTSQHPVISAGGGHSLKQEQEAPSLSLKTETHNSGGLPSLSELRRPQATPVVTHSNQGRNMSQDNSITSGTMQPSYPVMVQLNGQNTSLGATQNTSKINNQVNNMNGMQQMPSIVQQNMQHQMMNSHHSMGPSHHQTLSSRASSEYGSNSNLYEAKQKLKETLTNNNPNLHNSNLDDGMSDSSDLMLDSMDMEEPKPRRRGRQSQEIDPDVKRQRFLERNRAAASRCRNKKKKWVNGLESKAKGLSQINVQLQNEIASLKDEIASLKQLLLSHRDCPITKMQQQTMAMQGITLDLESDSAPILTSVKSETSVISQAGFHQSLSASLSNASSIEDNMRSNTQQPNRQPVVTNGQYSQQSQGST